MDKRVGKLEWKIENEKLRVKSRDKKDIIKG
jgi:hypothetical protein